MMVFRNAAWLADKRNPVEGYPRWFAVWLGMFLVCIASFASAETSDSGARNPFRLAFSSSMFRAVNETDIRAAMKVWILTVAKDLDIPVDPDPHIQPTVEALEAFARSHPVDGFALVTPEMFQLRRSMPFDRVALGTRAGRYTDDYLLVVRRDRNLQALAQLKDREIIILDSPRMSLARVWLDTILLESGLDRAADFFSFVNLNKDPSKVVLSVFFGNMHACLITRASFGVLGELNPQLTNQLMPLAASPAFVPTGFAFVAENASPFRDAILTAMERLGDSPAGRQILALTHADRIKDYPIAVMNESFDLLAKHRRLVDRYSNSAVHPLGNSAVAAKPESER